MSAPLDPGLRAFFEPRLGIDLGRVKVSDGAAAAASARERRARAYTVGDHIVFGAGHYRPSTPSGRWLLAHELAHVAQARRGAAVGDATPAVERDASRVATALVRGRAARVRARTSPRALHRFGEPDQVPDLTFISTAGEQGFLNSAVRYHTTWGLAPRRVDTLAGLLGTLSRGTGSIGRLRIVSHADFDNLFMPMFPGGVSGIGEDELLAFAESDIAGRRATRDARPFQATDFSGTALRLARTANPAALQPFGLDQPGSAPAGAVAQLVEASATLRLVRAVPQPTTAGQATLTTALNAEIAALIAQVQQPAPGDAGVTAADARALRDAILNVQLATATFTMDPDRVSAIGVTTAGLAAGFRANLEATRRRLSSASWIDLRGCRVGERPAYLAAVATFFTGAGGRPHVSGPSLFQSYPRLGWQQVDDAGVAGLAADTDVQAALAHWAVVTGLRERLQWWRRFWLQVIVDDLRLSAPPPARPPLLSGGLHLDLDPLLLPSLPSTTLTTPPPGAPSPTARFGVQAPRLQNPMVAWARVELARYSGADGELRYYLDCALPLPVQLASNPEDIRLHFKVGLERRAIDAWLVSQWATAAPGLPALRRGDWRRDQLRQVEALSQLDASRNTLAMFVSPDPRYDAAITRI